MFAGFVLFCIAVATAAMTPVGRLWPDPKRPHPRARHTE